MDVRPFLDLRASLTVIQRPRQKRIIEARFNLPILNAISCATGSGRSSFHVYFRHRRMIISGGWLRMERHQIYGRRLHLAQTELLSADWRG